MTKKGACGLWMEFEAQSMSPERVLPEPEAEAEGQGHGSGLGPAAWSSEEEEEDEDEELAGSIPEEEPGPVAGYRYLPLEQEPGVALGHPEPDIEERLQELRLYLPEAPVDSEEDEPPEHSSQHSIPMDPEHVELVKRTMAAIKFPSLGVPAWAQEISDEQWQSVVRQTIENRRSVVAAKE
ncbi:male-enhanced antigen 1 [Hypanus sabinus]|uniref:male-enhanced antigen 1 n=1 Tax=Hypanus sabinus TaxID=79690 RepID=UPI0028C4D0F1|nr:male-enhanced antigen 1 [Hypanus sabinus]